MLDIVGWAEFSRPEPQKEVFFLAPRRTPLSKAGVEDSARPTGEPRPLLAELLRHEDPPLLPGVRQRIVCARRITGEAGALPGL